MARNQEKAQSMLYRFREAMLIEAGVKRHPKDKTPLLPASTTSIPIAEQARRDLLKDINRKIGRIQDRELESSVVRSLNDEINETIGRVKAWDERIRELGGLSRRSQRRIEELETAAVINDASPASEGSLVQIDGKYYFGQARTLPEVVDHLQHQALVDRDTLETQKLRQQRLNMYAQVNQAYYGIGEEDEEMVREEMTVETLLRQRDPTVKELFSRDWVTDQARSMRDENEGEGKETGTERNEQDLLAEHEGLPVPTQEQVEAHLVERRKRALLSKYVYE